MMNDPREDLPQEEDPQCALNKELYQEARKKALHLLEYADRTEKQLRDKLKMLDFPSQVVDDAIAYVRSFHYLDDRRFAENFLRNRREQKSLNEIRLMLSEKGISREILNDLLDASYDSEKDTVKKLFLKKYGQKDLTDPALYQKAFRYFSGKGFQYEDIRSAIEEALEDTELQEEDD